MPPHYQPCDDADVLTTGLVATICQVSPRTAANWIDSGALKGYRVPPAKNRYVRKLDLIEFMSAHGMNDLLPNLELLASE